MSVACSEKGTKAVWPECGGQERAAQDETRKVRRGRSSGPDLIVRKAGFDPEGRKAIISI